MSCTWTIFEGGEVVKGRKKTTVKEFVRMKREEMGNLTIDEVKDERANTD